MKAGAAAAAGQVCRRKSRADRVAGTDVVVDDQDVDGFELSDRRGGLPPQSGPTGRRAKRQCRRRQAQDESDDTRGFHTLHFPQNAATDTTSHLRHAPTDTWSRAWI